MQPGYYEGTKKGRKAGWTCGLKNVRRGNKVNQTPGGGFEGVFYPHLRKALKNLSKKNKKKRKHKKNNSTPQVP